MNTMQIDINKVRIIDKQSAFNNQLVNVTVVDGYISSITPVKASQTKGLSTILADGKEVWKSSNKTEEIALSPGWVDLLADYCEPGFEHKEDLASGLQAAAGGGFTDVLLAPNTQPAVSSKSIIQYIRGCTADNIVNLHPMGTASQNAEGKELAEMMDMQAAGAIAFTDGWKPIQNANLMLKALEYVKPFCGIIIQLPIDASLATGGLMNEGIVSTGLGMPGVPELAETLMIYRDIEYCRGDDWGFYCVDSQGESRRTCPHMLSDTLPPRTDR